MRRYIYSLVALIVLAAPALAQSTKSQLNSEVTSNFPDNTTGLITPTILRTTVNDFISSWQQAPRVNAQTGTTYTFVVGDYGYLVTFSNASPVAVTLPQATGSFATFNVTTCNLNSGAVTITPTTSTIGGGATKVLQQGQCTTIVSDATNYQIASGSIQSVTCAASNWVNAITSAGVPTCSQPTFPDISGTLALNKGGTNASLTASNGGVFYSTASAAAILAGTATAGLPLLSGSTAAPTWATISYPGSATSGGVPYFSSATAMASSGALTLNGPVLGGGAGGAPTSMVAGTNGQLVVGQSASASLWKTISGDWTLTAAGVNTVVSVNGVAFPTSPSTNTVPVVTGANAITYEAVPNAALANSTITLNAGSGVGLTAPGSMALGSTNTIGSTSDTPRFAGIGLGGAGAANQVKIYGISSGSIAFAVPSAAGSNTITWPAGTTDFSATGGTSQVVKQTSAGGALTVAQLAFSDISNTIGASQIGAATITGQTVNNSPSASNDYFMYFDSANNRISKCTVGSCAAAATAGVSSLNGLTGGLSIVAGTGISVSATGTSVTPTNTGVVNTYIQTFCPSGCTTTVAAGSTGTYTPHAGLIKAEIECQGTGAGGGGAAAPAGFGSGGGGGAGSRSVALASAATIGASQTVSIGSLGTGGASGNNNGTAGGDTSLGTICVGKGGSAGGGASANNVGTSGAGGVAGTGNVLVSVGTHGGEGIASAGISTTPIGGSGGSSFYGGGGPSTGGIAATNGHAATGWGSGGAGGIGYNGGAAAGGDGFAGVVIIRETASQ